MNKLLIIVFAALSTLFTATAFANQDGQDQIALMELERDFMVLVNEAKKKHKKPSNIDDEPDCE